MDLKDKVVVVIGVGWGLGCGIVESLVGCGVCIVCVDFNEDDLCDIVVCCEQVGGEVKSYWVNVVKEEEVIVLFDGVVVDFGVLYGLVNNVGIICDGLLVKFKDGVL